MLPKNKGKKADIVAITFYSKRIINDDKGYHPGVFGDKDHVHRMYKGFEEAARSHEKHPPTFEITLFLIPHWESGERYNSPAYIQAKHKMLEDAKKTYGENIIIKDFLADSKVSEAELEFLVDCKSIGSVADLVKTRVIIDSKGHNCLQTDANVTWANNDFQGVYKRTFLIGEDAYNASRCSDVYIAVHNKLIFIGSKSKLPDLCKDRLIDYCEGYKNDEWHKSPTCNGVYDFAFCEAMYDIGAAHRIFLRDKYNPSGPGFIFYPAKIQESRFKLMPFVIPCQRESWRAGVVIPAEIKILAGLAPIVINQVLYDYYHFKSLIKVFTNIPSWHQEKDFVQFTTPSHIEGAEYARDIFIKSQDQNLCLIIMASYYNHVVELSEKKHVSLEVVKTLANLIPETAAGNELCAKIFGCSVADLRDSPLRKAKIPEQLIKKEEKSSAITMFEKEKSKQQDAKPKDQAHVPKGGGGSFS